MARNNEYMKNLDKFIGNKIYELRLSRSLSRQKLADMIDVTHQQLQKYEKGINRLSVGRLILVAQVFKVFPSYFFEGFDEKLTSFEANTQKQRSCLDLTRDFMRIANPDQQEIVKKLAHILVKTTKVA